MIIYLDESGDLGFDFSKSKTSRKLVITLLVCEGKDATESFRKAVRRTLKNKLNRKKQGSRIVQELKGVKTSLAIKVYFYKHLVKKDWQLYTVIDKCQDIV